ncbi:glycosyltransferase family 2 protein [Celerinatantimonas diazotrophica]|uniref:glycosyltransferase family 2 protein n=1 Tax=Celerinatantimonas diazotrophica TaxID=412034 RepID=UPI001CC498A0|nr:glycosyltransferase family A protein [Celerinatantimonas diazotrophica]CAG9297714.1 hypothetical protein CEDIAZO_02903 [Celerinatantimonas diazotrophica]
MKLSVIMPTYNRVEYLKRAIDSVFNQTWKEGDIELVIVDDASTDATQEYVLSLENTNIKYVKNLENRGGAESRNIGFKYSSGNYIAFIDSDVIWYRNKLERQMPVVISNPDKIIYCQYRKQKKRSWTTQPSFVKNGYIFDDLLYQNFVDTPSVIMKREFFIKIDGFDKELPRFQDWDLFLRLSREHEFLCIKELLYDSLTLSNSISADHIARLRALTIIFKKNENYIISNKTLLERFIVKLVNANLICDKFENCCLIINEFNISSTKKIILNILIKIFIFYPRGSINYFMV